MTTQKIVPTLIGLSMAGSFLMGTTVVTLVADLQHTPPNWIGVRVMVRCLVLQVAAVCGFLWILRKRIAQGS